MESDISLHFTQKDGPSAVPCWGSTLLRCILILFAFIRPGSPPPAPGFCSVKSANYIFLLAFGTQVRGFKPGRSRRIFQGEKILSTPSFGREVKPFVPCLRFTACKRSLNVTWKSGIFRQNSSAISRPSSSSFHYYGLWRRNLAVQVETTKDQGLYNKPSAAVHPGALTAGTLPHNITYFCP